MAGDWMKIELELPDKPEVHSIASMLNIDPDAVVGKLIRIWQWFDKHTTDGNAYGVTYSLPDRISGVTGFAEAMVFVGWLEQNDKTLTMPKFERHTSSSAKTRALTKNRVSKTRNAVTVTEALPEKRREEKIKDIPQKQRANRADVFPEIQNRKIVDDWLAIRKLKKLAVTETALEGFANEVTKAGFTVEQALIKCCHEGWGGFKAKWIVEGKTNEPKKAWE